VRSRLGRCVWRGGGGGGGVKEVLNAKNSID